MYSITYILAQYPAKLTNSETPHLDCRLLLEHAIGHNHAWLIAHHHYQLTEAQWQLFKQSFEKREAGIPIAYITGEREFWGLSLSVTSDVLIPRPDTETLVAAALEYANNFGFDQSVSILDLGVGSGAIALALASELPNASILACDSNKAALALAKQNAIHLKLNQVDFIHSDWFTSIAPQKFDLIVSNPPYIDKQDTHLYRDGICYEPINALVAAQNGLADIMTILAQAPCYMHEDSRLFIEHGYDQAQQVHDLFETQAYIEVEQAKDLAGHVRVTSAKRTS